MRKMQFQNEYLNYLQLENKATNTIDTYRFHLQNFKKWLEQSNHSLETLRPKNLIEFKEFLLKNNKSERTVNGILSCLRGYFDYLILQEVTLTNPVSNLLRMKVKTKRQARLNDEQLRDFYSFIDGLQPNIRAAFYLMIGSGARVGEVSELRRSDFYITNGKMFIDIHDAKWGSDRKVPVVFKESAIVVYEYLQSIEISSEVVFRVTKRTLQTYATMFSRKTNIPFSCHILRHTFATLLKEQGIEMEKIQYLLGHKSSSMTAHYTQSANTDVNGLAPSIL